MLFSRRLRCVLFSTDTLRVDIQDQRAPRVPPAVRDPVDPGISPTVGELCSPVGRSCSRVPSTRPISPNDRIRARFEIGRRGGRRMVVTALQLTWGMRYWLAQVARWSRRSVL